MELNDEHFKKYIDSLGRLNPADILSKLSAEEISYLLNRFKDSESLKETIKRIYYEIEERPKCIYCGASCRPYNNHYNKFHKTCNSTECKNKYSSEQRLIKFKETHNGLVNPFQLPEVIVKIQEKRKQKQQEITQNIKQSLLQKYGVDNVAKLLSSKEKSKLTCLLKYGVEYSFQSNNNKIKSKQTCLEKYGFEYARQSETIKEKIKLTCLEKYGVECTLSSDIIKEKARQTCLEKYGSIYFSLSDIGKEKIKSKILLKLIKEFNTRKKNNTFNTSKPEQQVKLLLYNKFGSDNVIYQYKSDLYPYNCDFYIKHLDLYIECNFHWTHNNHKFNENDMNDILLLNKWKEKSLTSNFYKNAIMTWTVRDINKFKYAEDNNLNYKAFYNIAEVKHFLETDI